MTSHFADNVLCAVTANESGQTTIFGFVLVIVISSLSLLLHCVHSKKVKKKKCKKIEKKETEANIYDKIT